MIVQGKKLLITGVLTPDSYAYSVARLALEDGAEIALTTLPDERVRRLVERSATRLQQSNSKGFGKIVILDMDVNNPDDIRNVRDHLAGKWGSLNGVLHSIAFAPRDALGGNFLNTPYQSAAVAFQTSAFSLQALTVGLIELLEKGRPSSVVTMTFDSERAYPSYDWMGVSKAALEAVVRYLALNLGPSQIRVNAVSAGPARTVAARGIPGFDNLADSWLAPLGWDLKKQAEVAKVVLCLFSDYTSVVTGEVIHADGGAHAVAPISLK